MKKSLFIFLIALNLSFANDFTFQWASYTTYFKQNIDDRGINIETAARYLDMTVILPKTIFSFNEDITAKIPPEELGNASIMSGEKRVPGYGGGLCQVSSTLYATALYAGLSIYERKNHSKIVSYIPAGLDATVSVEECVDLKIYNPYRCKLLIKASVFGNSLTVSICGTEPRPRDIEISVSKPQKIGQFVCTTTTRHVFSKNKLIFSQIVSRDTYIAE